MLVKISLEECEGLSALAAEISRVEGGVVTTLFFARVPWEWTRPLRDGWFSPEGERRWRESDAPLVQSWVEDWTEGEWEIACLLATSRKDEERKTPSYVDGVPF